LKWAGERQGSWCKFMAEVWLENVTKIYPGPVRAVDNLFLKIADGEIIVLVGPSGCGKSTTLRMVAGLETVTAGTIRIGDRVVNDVAPRERDVAIVFQNYALYPHMTVYKNMAFGLKLRRLPRAEIDGKVRSAARLLGIEGLLGRKPKALSGGQQQRVAVGRAIVRTPRVFLFDEPLSNLDAKLRLEMRAELKKIHRRLGATTIYVTHDQEEAMSLGERVGVMKEGRLLQCATPIELYDRPANRFVAGFVGTPSMNFLTGRIVAGDGHLYFDAGPGRLRLPDRLRESLTGRVGGLMTLGVRPQNLSPVAEGRMFGVENVLDVTVRMVEPLGDKMDVYVETAEAEGLVCRVDGYCPLKDGMALPMHLNMDQVHVFEPGDEGVNVSLTGAGDHAGAA